MSFRFSRCRWCLCRAALRPGTSDPGGDPRVLLELQEEHPIGEGKRAKHRDNSVQFRASRVTCCMSVLFLLRSVRGRFSRELVRIFLSVFLLASTDPISEFINSFKQNLITTSLRQKSKAGKRNLTAPASA